MNRTKWANGGPIRLRCDHYKQLVGWKFSSALLRLLWGSVQFTELSSTSLVDPNGSQTQWRQMLLGRNSSRPAVVHVFGQPARRGNNTGTVSGVSVANLV